MMYLNIHNQLTLLHDLLHEQLIYSTDNSQDYKQMKKLIQTMITHRQVNQELLAVLPEIYYYCLKGEHAHSYSTHIHDHKQKIQYWLQLINRSKLNRSS